MLLLVEVDDAPVSKLLRLARSGASLRSMLE